ncbi:uridine kinase [Janthinobacterium sp. MDB2-8]|uniref:uridine kinase n=1 Tax=Janthinobacterium sp. MDB2-8 TaxID=1259338 RepID=UPI003F1F913E
MKKLFLNPLFLLGLLIRVLLIGVVLPAPVVNWYVPFLDVSTSQFTIDPWGLWLSQGGVPAAFPYGYVMWLIFLPLSLLFKVLGLPLLIAYGLTLASTDLALFFLLQRIVKASDKLLLATYWLSPIVIIASYMFGFNDLIPVLLLTLSLYLARQSRMGWSGVACIAAISAKLSMALALPFFLILMLHNRALRQYLPQFLKGLAIGALLLLLPFMFSSAGVDMLFNNPEIGKIYRLALNLDGHTLIYLVPCAYLLMLYAAWRVRRLNFQLFNAMLGMAFLLVVLMTPAAPGWFVWAIPLLVAYQATSDKVGIALTAIFSLLYVMSSLLLTHDTPMLAYLAATGINIAPPLAGRAVSLLHTTMVATGIVLLVRIWRETVSSNDYFRLSRKPFVIGVAGDSGAGKDTFSDAIKGLFGGHSVTTLSGDDYHLWDRQKPMWQVMTHLNPMANDLEGFANDLVALTDGKSIQSRHYNHQTGRMSRPFNTESNDFIIASGLHALYMPILRECYNLSVYLDIDEDLRRHFKFQRDVHQRGHTPERVLASFERREPDSARFIRPQAGHADLVLSLKPIHPRMLEDRNGKHPLRFKLVARSRHGLNELSLTRVLVGICGLHVDMIVSADGYEVELSIEGETSAQDVEMAARMICPRIFEFLDMQADWKDGVMGLMQLITLSHINQALTKRFIW